MAKSNQDSMFVQFIMDYKHNIYRLAYSYVKNKDDALDIVQDSIYKAMKARSSLRDPGALKSWFYRIVVRTAHDLLRKRKRVQPMADENLHMFISQSEDHYPNIDLARVLDKLPKIYRDVIILRYFEDLKIEEVAVVLNEKVSTIKTRIYRALDLLNVKMNEGEHNE